MKNVFSKGCNYDVRCDRRLTVGRLSGLDAKCIDARVIQVNPRITLIRFAFALLLFLSLGVGNVWGTVATLTFSSSPSNNKVYTDDKSHSWTFTTDGGYLALDNSTTIHSGSGTKTASHVTFTSSAFTGATITQITITGYGSSCGAYATVNGSNFGTQNQTATSSGTTRTFTGNVTVTGNVVVKLQRGSATKNAIYCSQVSVTYTTGGEPTTYTVTYNANGDGAGTATGTTGNVPTDTSSPYAKDATVTVLGNVGSPALAKAGHTFIGWNTAADGSGTSYSAGNTFTMGTSNIILYAQWKSDAADRTFKLVEDVSKLSVGQHIVIAAYYSTNTTYYAMSTDRGNNRLAVAAGASEFAMSNSNKTLTTASTTTLEMLTLTSTSSGYFGFLALNGNYLYAAGDKSNYLKTKAYAGGTLDNDSKWKITLSAGDFSVEADQSSNRYDMRFNYNSNNPTLFSCYATGGTNTRVLVFAEPTCEDLSSINGSVNWSNPTTAVVSWDNIANVSSWTVKYKTHAAVAYTTHFTSKTGSDSEITVYSDGGTNNKMKTTISSLTCGTDYDFQIIANPASGYCDNDQTIEDSQTHKYTITRSGSPAGTVTGGTFTTKISGSAVTDACNGSQIDIVATPETGYQFSSWTISKAGGGSVTPNAASASTYFTMPSDNVTVTPSFSCINPTITVDPADANYYVNASPSALSVTATLSSGTLTYLWKVSTDNGDTWSNAGGTNNASTYSGSSLSTASEGTIKFKCIVGNSEGGCTVESEIATISVTAASNFVNGTTVFIQAESNSAWDSEACVKAYFNNNGSGGSAEATYWLFNATGGDSGKKLFATVVPSSGTLNQVQLQRFASDCSTWWNSNGDLTASSANGSNTFRSTGSGTSNVAWNGSGVTLSLKGDPDEWEDALATFADQGSGVWTATYNNYAPSATSADFKISTNYNGWIGNGGDNDNATLSDMIVGSTYNVTATLNVTTHALTMSKTYVKGTVHFNMNSHGSAVSDLTNVTAGSKISAPSAPTDAEYNFGGWYKEAGCTNAWNFSSDVVNETMTLYAKWTAKPTYTITYNVPTCASVSPTSAQETIIEGNAIGTLPTPTSSISLNGSTYTFHGWATSEITTETAVVPTIITTSYVPDDDTDLYAVYKRTADVPTGEFTLSVKDNGSDYYLCGLSGNTKYFEASTSSTPLTLGIDDVEGDKYLYYWNSTTKTYIGNVDADIKTATTTDGANIHAWTIDESDGTITITYGTGSGARDISYSAEFTRFKAYQSSSDSYIHVLTKHDILASGTVYITNLDCREEHDITISPTPSHGEVTYDGTPKVGETITLTVTPDEGYATTALTATYNDGSSKSLVLSPELTDVAADYTFTMPDYDVTVSATFTARPATPTISHTTGKYAGTQSVTLDCETDGATIYYTTDGTAPTSSSSTYSSAISVSSNTTIKAIAYKTGVPSLVASSAITILVGGTEYVAKTLSEIWDNDEVIYVATRDDNSYMMSNNNGTSKQPSAYDITDSLTVASSLVTKRTDVQWNIVKDCSNDTLIFYPNGTTSTWLYTFNDNNGVRVGTGTDKKFVIKGAYLYNIGQGRYVGKYKDAADWRCYTSIHDNIKNADKSAETFTYYVKSPSTAFIATPCPSTLSGFETTYNSGSPSSAQSFSVKARNISTGNVTITAPTGYEVCLTADGTYTSSVTITPVSSSVAPTTVYVRLKSGLNAGSVNGDITISAAEAGATSRTLALTGTVNKAEAGLTFTAATYNLTLTGSSISSGTDLFSTNSGGTLTVTVTKGGSASSGVSLNTTTGQFTATADGTYTVTLSQATTDNYLAAEVSCTVSVTCGTPDTPTGLTVSDISHNGATLSWDAVDGADHYELYVTDADEYELSEDNVTGTSYELTGLSPNVEYLWTLNVVNNCGSKLETEVDGDEFTTLTLVTYHAPGDDDHLVELTNGDDVSAYSPVTGCANKEFKGWTNASVTSLQQSSPTITTTDGALDDVTENTDLYAVYAVRNGLYAPFDDMQSYSSESSYGSTGKKRGMWIVDYGCPSGIKDVTDKFGAGAIVMAIEQHNVDSEGNGIMQTQNKIRKVKGVSFKVMTTNTSTYYYVEWSTDGSTWNTIGGSNTNTSVQTKTFNLPSTKDAYVRIRVSSTAGTGSGYRAYIDDVQFILDESAYWYSDYSTTCDRPSSATMTITDGGSITSVASYSLPYVYTIDTITATHLSNTVPTKPGYLFSHYTIQGVNYYRGDSYVMGHDVTATANWIDIPPTLSGTDIYVTSSNGVATTSSMSITATGDFHTSGTLTIANVTGDQGGTFSAAITNAEVDGTLNATITVTYTPTKANVSETATMTATINGQSANFTVHGRSLPSSFVVVANTGGTSWTALPADMTMANQYVGYGISLDNTTTPTTATLAPEAACYTFYGGSDGAVRLAASDGDHTLWASRSDTKIRNYALIGGATAANYQWTMATTDNVSYTLYNANANSGAGRYLCVSDGKWGMYASGVSTFRFLPVTSTTSHINMTVTEWDESAFTFTTSDALPGDYNNVKAVYATTTDTLSVTQTGASSPYTLSIDGTDFSAHSGKTLIIQWRKGNEVRAFGTVVTPIFIKTEVSDLSAYVSEYDAESLAAMDMHISGTLNISTNTSVHNVTIASGGSLNITGSTTLHMNKLALEGGWNTAKTAYDVPRVYIAGTAALQTSVSTVNYDISIDKSNYYPLAVPFRVKVSDIDYAETLLATYSTYKTHYVIKEYDGATRAESGTTDACWKVVEQKNESKEDVYLEPGRGYIITAVPVGGKAVIRIPLSIPNTWTSAGEKATIDNVYFKNQIAVTAYTGTAANASGDAGKRHKGWNLLGVPYMSCYTAGTDMYSDDDMLIHGRVIITGGSEIFGYDMTYDVPYVSVPAHDFAEYIQTELSSAKLVPGWCFFVQVGTTGSLTFLTSQQAAESDMPIYAPQRQDAAMPINRFALKLTGADHSDKTTVIVSDRYTTDYEIGADLEKLFGNSYTLATYTISQGQPMAFNAMPESTAQQIIPVGARFPEQGVYTFALEQIAGLEHFERIDLIDYETGQLTNLLTDSYTFSALRTQTDERFAINAVISTHNTPTDIIPPTDSGGTHIEKRIVDDKLYIFTPSAVYDATGKRVFDINGKEGAK